jgi:hypothetical protein
MLPLGRAVEPTSLLLRNSDRLVSARSREVDKYLSAPYRSILGLCREFRPWDCYIVEANAINFLLKTSPPHIYNSLREDITKLCASDFEIQEEIKHLLRIRRVVALLPFNPSYFVSRVERWRAVASTREADSAIDVAQKQYRAELKQSRGRLVWKVGHGHSSINESAIYHSGKYTPNTYPAAFFAQS